MSKVLDSAFIKKITQYINTFFPAQVSREKLLSGKLQAKIAFAFPVALTVLSPAN